MIIVKAMHYIVKIFSSLQVAQFGIPV